MVNLFLAICYFSIYLRKVGFHSQPLNRIFHQRNYSSQKGTGDNHGKLDPYYGMVVGSSKFFVQAPGAFGKSLLAWGCPDGRLIPWPLLVKYISQSILSLIIGLRLWLYESSTKAEINILAISRSQSMHWITAFGPRHFSVYVIVNDSLFIHPLQTRVNTIAIQQRFADRYSIHQVYL